MSEWSEMRVKPAKRARRAGGGCSLLRGISSNDDGSAAVEFGIIAVPFFLFVFGLIGYGMYFFTMNSLEWGVETAARAVRTGQAQKGGTTVGQFKNDVCAAAGNHINCNKLNVIVQHAANWGGVTPQACVGADGKLTASTGSSGELISKYSGSESEVVLVTLCYTWELASQFPFLKLGQNSDGSGAAILQASTAFRSEPYLN
jgi:Flp pilus assembly protein TadG